MPQRSSGSFPQWWGCVAGADPDKCCPHSGASAWAGCVGSWSGGWVSCEQTHRELVWFRGLGSFSTSLPSSAAPAQPAGAVALKGTSLGCYCCEFFFLLDSKSCFLKCVFFFFFTLYGNVTLPFKVTYSFILTFIIYQLAPLNGVNVDCAMSLSATSYCKRCLMPFLGAWTIQWLQLFQNPDGGLFSFSSGVAALEQNHTAEMGMFRG